MKLTLHRGGAEIGGTCIELRHSTGARLILDAGRPLDAPPGATGLLPATLETSNPATVLVCHAHQDHWGLLADLPESWPVHCGTTSARLITLTSRFARRPIARALQGWTPGTPFHIGPFRITPLLTDHSAFDAAMLLVEADERRVLYSGDFRRHGRKAALVDRLMADPPAEIDLLILEGTNLGTDKPAMTEDTLETRFVDLMARMRGRILTAWSGQNIDRTVTLYRAAKRSGRPLVVDLYTAEVLEAVAEGTRIPRPGFPGLQVVFTTGLVRHYRAHGRQGFLDRMASHGISARLLTNSRGVVMVRDGLVPDYAAKGVVPGPEDAFVWSTWRGYHDPASPVATWARAAETVFLHTSGHASAADLRAFAQAMRPRRILPVHGVNWAAEGGAFANLASLPDGGVMDV